MSGIHGAGVGAADVGLNRSSGISLVDKIAKIGTH